ncbi:TetR/AcrR family transcriptional regulator [Peredibacter starrii]|uniref:TetR/AcrR family transcriptional regulator n=1 Tax=Peredibacter starrii TaxID=28202 RepID=A0AAX4HTT8_9BACT|nr:TetR/AcrR family transcriptional regulator [Peredibacter starrii]WPU66641.1 TetR/AcrR family transcriptional regulator [Peredibacter starrii]
MGRTKQFDRTEVLKEAIQLFWKKGYADTSLSDLEKATGVNKSGLYSEFKDKDDIFLEALKLYRETHPGYAVLENEPFGWHNIENFFKANMTCKGQKGCFLSNTTREYSIIPQKVKNLMEENSVHIYELLLKNIKATGTKKDPDLLAKMIMTYAGGASLKLNAMKPEALEAETKAFLEMLKN